MQQKITEEIYRQVVLQWKKDHPEKKCLDIKHNETMKLDGIGIINIGMKINKYRKIYNAMQQGKSYGERKELTKEQITWDEEQGMIWDYQKYQEEQKEKQIKEKVL